MKGESKRADFPFVLKDVFEAEVQRHEQEMQLMVGLCEFLVAHLDNSVEERGFSRVRFKRKPRKSGRPRNSDAHKIMAAEAYEYVRSIGESADKAYDHAAAIWETVTGRAVSSDDHIKKLVRGGRELLGRKGQRVKGRKT